MKTLRLFLCALVACSAGFGLIGCWSASTAPSAGTSGYLNGVWGRDTATVWAVGDAGTIDFWDGTHWTACTATGTQNVLHAVH